MGASAGLAGVVAGERRRARGGFVLALLIAAVVVTTVLMVSRGEETATSVRPGGSSQGPGRSLYSRQDRALMAAVAAGLVPEAALETEHFLIIRLVNQGLIPRETLEP